MDWLKARSFLRLGSIRATLRVAADELADAAPVLVDELVLLDELELQATAASATARPATSGTGRGSRWCFIAASIRGWIAEVNWGRVAAMNYGWPISARHLGHPPLWYGLPRAAGCR
jgi:hypothetical protein